MKKLLLIGSIISAVVTLAISCDKLGSTPFTAISGEYKIENGKIAKLNSSSQKFVSDFETYADDFFRATIFVIGNRESSITDPGFLKNVKILQDAIEEHVDEVSRTISVADYVAKIHQEYTKTEKDPKWIPDDKNSIGQYLFLYQTIDNDTLSYLTNSTYSEAMIYIKKKTNDVSGSFIDTIVEEVKQFSLENEITVYISTKFPPPALIHLEEIRVTDNGFLIIKPQK